MNGGGELVTSSRWARQADIPSSPSGESPSPALNPPPHRGTVTAEAFCAPPWRVPRLQAGPPPWRSVKPPSDLCRHWWEVPLLGPPHLTPEERDSLGPVTPSSRVPEVCTSAARTTEELVWREMQQQLQRQVAERDTKRDTSSPWLLLESGFPSEAPGSVPMRLFPAAHS